VYVLARFPALSQVFGVVSPALVLTNGLISNAAEGLNLKASRQDFEFDELFV
jgi:hypothetical protein